MAETTMPAAEAAVATAQDDERNSYEFAFHILPTVAEGEVESVFAALKETITKDGGELFDEEAPERFELAYPITEHLEGKNRTFENAYFGWVRFKAVPESIAKITSEMDARNDLLRYLLIRLTKEEEENPFRFHEALKEEKQVTTVEESSVIPDVTTMSDTGEVPSSDEEKKTEKESGEVDEEALDEALEKKDL